MPEKKGDAHQEFIKGLWRDNPVFVQVLGMCPMLAVTNSAVNALAMEGDLPVVEADTCIACFCCQEMCPEQAIKLD